MILIFFFYIFKQFELTFEAVCTRNPEYGNALSSSIDILLCKNADCKADNMPYLETIHYYGCVTVTNKIVSPKREVSLKIMRKAQTGNIASKCFENTVWKPIIASQPCLAMSEFTFAPFQMTEFDVYIISCEGYSEEIPYAGDPRIQIYGFDNENQDIVMFRPVLFPTHMVKCVANCKELIPKITVTAGSTYITVTDNMLSVNVNIVLNALVNIPMISTICTANTKKRNFNFYIANNLTSEINSPLSGKSRNPNLYDAGESVACLVYGKSTLSNTTGSPPPTFITLVTLDNSQAIKKYYTEKNNPDFKVPEGLPVSESYYYYCYFGNLSTSNIYEVKMERFSIGARLKTKLKTVTPSQEFDFSPGTEIWCDGDYYKNLNTSLNLNTGSLSLSLYILYATNTSYPMSNLQNYLNREWDNATSGNLVFTRKFANKQMYVFCTVDMYMTTPVPIFAGDRPKLNITYIHPKWKTDYQLKGFILACVGHEISDIDFTCMNCLPDMRMTITKVGSSSVELEVPQTVRKSFQIIYRCTGYSNRYDSVSISLPLNIIVSEYTDIDTRNLFFSYAQDYIKCISQFTVQVNSISVKKEIIMPILVQVNSEPILNVDGSEKYVLLIGIGGIRNIVTFQACCPPLGAGRKYSCLGKWKIVKVARDFKPKYNLDLSEVYPGNLLKCFICVNFTDDTVSKPCEKENKISSFITMNVVYPDGRENNTGEQPEVHAPVEELKPDKQGYYKITDYVVTIGCKVRRETIMQSLNMKSCNLNPPKIHISPPDKTMFVVGDIFSCTTDVLNCKNGLAYTIYVQRGNEPAEKKDSHSFTLNLAHIGNNINVKCAAGEAESAVDTRLIRVEVSPYNVSIPNVPRIMVYGNYLSCLSSGFPPPSVKWTQLKGPSILRLSETFVLIGPWVFPGDYMMQCEAKNKRGSVTTSTSFQVFNPRIVYSDESLTFNILIPFFTLLYIILLLLSLLAIFQESIFGVPFFSQGSSGPTSNPKVKDSVMKDPSPVSIKESSVSKI